MNIKAVFFDLDGTLLSMVQEIFVKTYFDEFYETDLKKSLNGTNFIQLQLMK